MRTELIRELVLTALDRILEEGRPADRVLERTLRANRDLSAAERAAVARRILGVALFRARLDHLVRAADLEGEGAPLGLAAYLLDQEVMTVAEAAREADLPEAAVARLGGPVAWPPDPIERLAAERSLPGWLARLWIEQLGAREADQLLEAINRPGPITARANRLRGTREALLARLASEGIESVPTRLAPDGVHLLGRPNVFGSRAWREGLFEVQDEGSQLVALLAAPRPGERCVDFCAGAGGKTLALAAMMEDRGALLALDPNRQRLADLRPRLARAGASLVQAFAIEPDGPPPPEALGADVVLVDAPCSSLGTLRRGPDARWRISPEEVAAFPALQRAILERAASCVRPGGRLVYATCTINRDENESVADRFEAEHPDFEPLRPEGEPLGSIADGGGRILLLPHVHGTDGFFACAWRRGGPGAGGEW